MNIPVVVVDDEEADRYLVKRRLARVGGFAEVIEEPSGDRFLEDYSSGYLAEAAASTSLLVLMDINMPGRNGFETIEELQRRMDDGQGLSSIAVMMFTSSNNVRDRERADEFSIVKGYITKPLDDSGVRHIMDLYRSSFGDS